MKSPLDRLKELDSQSVSFHEANQTMLNEGYSESDILGAVYRFNYDGKPDVPQKTDEIRSYFEKHPDEAKKLADELLAAKNQEIRSQEMAERVANLAASRYAPGHHAKAVYSHRLSGNMGIPFFSTLLVTAIGFALYMQFELPKVFVYLVPVGFIIICIAVNWLREKQ